MWWKGSAEGPSANDSGPKREESVGGVWPEDEEWAVRRRGLSDGKGSLHIRNPAGPSRARGNSAPCAGPRHRIGERRFGPLVSS